MAKKKPFEPWVRRTFRKVQQAILAEPKKYDQGTFGRESAYGTVSCGSPACIAGWFHVLAPKKHQVADVFRAPEGTLYAALNARHYSEVLHVVSADGRQWPEPYRTQFQSARTKKRKAEVAAARIQHLLDTGE